MYETFINGRRVDKRTRTEIYDRCGHLFSFILVCVKNKTKIRVLLPGTDNVNEMPIYNEIRCNVIDVQSLLFASRD